MRIIPDTEQVRPGYLFTALGHPTLGRPLIIRNAYGTSIPHLDPSDIATTPVVRLSEELEHRIADKAERATLLRTEADQLENEIAQKATALIDRYLSGKSV